MHDFIKFRPTLLQINYWFWKKRNLQSKFQMPFISYLKYHEERHFAISLTDLIPYARGNYGIQVLSFLKMNWSKESVCAYERNYITFVTSFLHMDLTPEKHTPFFQVSIQRRIYTTLFFNDPPIDISHPIPTQWTNFNIEVWLKALVFVPNEKDVIKKKNLKKKSSFMY